MKEGRRETRDRLAPGLERDREALERVTSQGLPPLSSVARAVRNRQPRISEGFFMSFARKHPFLAPALLTTAVLALLSFLPISFDRTVGHDVRLTLDGSTFDETRIAALAKEMKSQLGADQVAVNAEAQGAGAPTFTFTTKVAAKEGARARSVLDAFEKTLEEQGMRVSTAVTPSVERVSGTVAAYAADRVIKIETEGKSAAQIENEIRVAFEQAGMSGVQVSVQDEGEGKRRVEVHAEHDGASGVPAEPLQIQIGDEKPGDDRTTVDMRKIKDDAGVMTLKVHVVSGGRDSEAVIPNVDTMSDAALESEIERQLTAAGVNVDVTVTDGKINVTAR